MAQTVIRAAEGTENIPASRRVRDVSKRIHRLDPDASPFTVISKQKANKQSAFNTKYEWIEKDLEARWDQINNGAGYAAGATSVVVDNAAYFRVGDIVNIVRTGEKVLVGAVTTGTNTLDVQRGFGSTAAAAIVDNDDLQIIGNAFQEGDTSGTEMSHQETYLYNYTQIVRTPFGVTGSENESENYTGPDRARLRGEKSVMHMIDIERTFVFGERFLATTGSYATTNKPRRATGGFLYFAVSNVKDFGGVMTEPEVEDWCEQLFLHTGGSDTRFVAASAKAISVFDQLGVGRLELVPSDKTLGMTIKQFVTGHGTLMLAKHRLLEYGPSGQGYGGHMLAVEPSNIKYRYLRNRDTKLRMDIQANDLDGFKDEYLSEVGFQLMQPLLHGVGKNVTA